MKIAYVGRNRRQRDRLYGTGLEWRGPGDVQEVTDEKAAHQMITNHPDVYAQVAKKHEPKAGDDPKNKPDPAENPLLEGQDGDAPPQPDGLPSFDDIQIEVDGEWILLKKARKEAIEAYALAHFEENLDRRKSQPKLAERLYELITEDHAKRAAEAAEQTGDESEGEQGESGTEQGEGGTDA